jgi:DNA-binding PadR family transcriptional regulator
VEQTLGETYPINNNQLYPTLRRLEQMGAITREVERQVGRPDRHIYHMTERGEQALQGLLRDFPPELARDVVEFQVRVAFFRLLEPAVRLTILQAREAVIRRQLEHLGRSHDLMPPQPELTFAARILTFNQEQLQHEIDWIAELLEEMGQETAEEERP